MRMIIPTIILAFSSLCVVNAKAAPSNSNDEIDRMLIDKGFLSHVDQVRQNVTHVTHKASELVLNAMGFLGVPYKWGGNTAETGFDCSGFVRHLYQSSIGLLLPRRAEQQAAATVQIEKTDLQPGDLVFFNTMRRAFSHVGVYVGNGKFIHAPKAGSEVRVDNLGGSYWQRHFDGARRVATTEQQSAPSPQALLLDTAPSALDSFSAFSGEAGLR